MFKTTTITPPTATDITIPSFGTTAIISIDEDNKTINAWKEVDEKAIPPGEGDLCLVERLDACVVALDFDRWDASTRLSAFSLNFRSSTNHSSPLPRSFGVSGGGSLKRCISLSRSLSNSFALASVDSFIRCRYRSSADPMWSDDTLVVVTTVESAPANKSRASAFPDTFGLKALGGGDIELVLFGFSLGASRRSLRRSFSSSNGTFSSNRLLDLLSLSFSLLSSLDPLRSFPSRSFPFDRVFSLPFSLSSPVSLRLSLVSCSLRLLSGVLAESS